MCSSFDRPRFLADLWYDRGFSLRTHVFAGVNSRARCMHLHTRVRGLSRNNRNLLNTYLLIHPRQATASSESCSAEGKSRTAGPLDLGSKTGSASPSGRSVWPYKGPGGGSEKPTSWIARARLQVDVATFDVFGKELFSRSSANNRQSSQKDPSLVPIEMYRSNVTD